MDGGVDRVCRMPSTRAKLLCAEQPSVIHETMSGSVVLAANACKWASSLMDATRTVQGDISVQLKRSPAGTQGAEQPKGR